MSVNLVSVNVQVPKELNDVKIALVTVLGHIAQGDAAFQAVLSSLGQLNEAVNNWQQIPIEVKEALGASVACAGLIGAGVIDALVKKPA